MQYRVSYNKNEGSNAEGGFGLAEIRRLFGIASQAGEVVFQTAGDRLSGFFRFVAGIEPFPDFVQSYYKEISNAVEYGAAIVDGDVSTHVANYVADLAEGNRLIVLAHSQGNYYVNLARQLALASYLEKTGDDVQSSFSILSVASPASRVSGGGAHATLEEDRIINGFVRFSTGGSTLPANITNFNRDEFLENDWTGHGVRSHYFKGTQSLARLRSMMANLVDGTQFPTAIVAEAIVTVALTWDEEPDVDLHIYEPDSTHVYYQNLKGSSGYLDRDDTDSFGPEHYYSSCDTLTVGKYGIGVNYFSGSGMTSGEVSIQAGPIVRTYPFSFSSPQGSSGDNPTILASFTVKEDEDGKLTFSAPE